MGSFGKHGHVVVLFILLSEVSLEDIFHTQLHVYCCNVVEIYVMWSPANPCALTVMKSIIPSSFMITIT